MEFIAHRINTIEELNVLPNEFGVELDLRDDLNGKIYIQHNPFETGDDFEEYLSQYHHGTMILNIKSERIEWKVLELLKKYEITEYFFLDSSFPMIYALANAGEKKIAIRVSELEGLECARLMAGKASWIWLDVFSKIPISKQDAEDLKALGYKLCLVSPELVGREEELESYKRQLEQEGIVLDAVCSKSYCIEKWR